MKRLLFWGAATIAVLLLIGAVIFGILLARHPV